MKKENLYLACVKAHKQINIRTSLVDRKNILEKCLIEAGIDPLKILDVGEVPASGANLSLMHLKNRTRINYRCGYSRHNYAPCLEILD